MSTRPPDPTRWVRALAEAGEQSGAHDPQAQLAAVVAGLERRRAWRGAAWAAGGLVGVAAAVLLVSWGRGAWMQTSSDDGFAAEAVAAPTPTSGEARQSRHDENATRSPTPKPRDVPAGAEPEPRPEGSPPTTLEPETRPPIAVPSRPRHSPRRAPPSESTEPDSTASPVAPTPPSDEPEQPNPIELDPVADLLAVATRARADRNAGVARDALVQIRDRFPDHPAAARATFLLGRVEEELAKDTPAAARWFSRYVAEFPNGEFAAQARGRVMTHLDRQGDVPGARAAARDYLEHHPDGTYARHAKDILR